MSLINEALKKAQRQRTDTPVIPSAPAPAGTVEAPVARISKRRPPMPARTLVVLIGGGVSLLLMGGVLVFVFVFNGHETAPAPAPSVASRPPPPAVGAQSSPPGPASSVASAAPAVQLPPIVVPAPSPSAPGPEASVVNAAPAVQLPPTVPGSPPSVPGPPSAPVASSRVHEFLEKLRVSGIRASDTDPKVIMNDRVYRLNDIVDRPTQLRLTRIEASTLVFVDASGLEYRKNF
jgi:hypothetical protein